MAEKESMLEKVKKAMWHKERIRNIGVIAHIDHGKTTTTDTLLAGAGMISYEVATQAMVTDFKQVEQERGITVQSADVNMVHTYKGEDYLINLIDTPGHVDFGGDVTRAIRAIDGALVLADAAEGVMPQTETVLRQALREKVKPVLFINKSDRLISELRLTPEKMQEQFLKIISDVNKLIRDLAPEEFKEKWQVNVQEGSVVFGSAMDKWALSFPIMKETGISFKDVVDAYQKGEDAVKEFAKKAPVHVAILDMIVKHLPSPVEAQKYRVTAIWHGDPESEVGKALLSCDEKGPLMMAISKVIMDPHAGEIAIARIYSGTLHRGDTVYLSDGSQTKAQQIYIWKGPHKYTVEEVPAGNIIGVVGLRGVSSGDTVSSIKGVEPFEKIKHIFEPVVTKAFEAKNPKDLNKLIEALRNKSREDPTLKVEINEETGEHLVSGLGELHLEIVEDDLRREMGLEIKTSPPIVVYRESVSKKSPVVEGKSPNKHNKFFITVEPLPDKVFEMIESGEIPEVKPRKKDEELFKKLQEAGFTRDDAKRVRDIFNGSILIDNTHGIVHINEVIEMVINAFEEVMKAGPVAKEPCMKVLVRLVDATLHEDAIHRGPAQVIPAVRDAIRQAMLQADPILYEPVQTIRIDSPAQFMGSISKIIQSRRGQLIDMQQEGESIIVKARLPVAEMFGFTDSLRGETEGRAFWFLVNSRFEKLSKSLQDAVVKKIRERKGLKTD
ncbi:MAG: elongation factor EF-2 [Nanoarchaeota archaeon]|nr:elongation factor EF-2 [Nanoarchaeota archaeon]